MASETPPSPSPPEAGSTAPPAADPPSGRPPEPQRVVDLTLGAWRPREAARQLAASLGIGLAPDLPSDPARSPVTTGRRGIDVGATGDPIALLGHDDARRIASALPAAGTVVVLTPQHGRGIGTFNDWLFHFLRRFALSLVIIGDEPATAMARAVFERRRDLQAPPTGKAIAEFSKEHQRLLRFFPGLLPRTLVEHFGIDAAAAALVPVGDGHFLIPPGYRDTDPAGAPTALDAMETVEAHDDGFKALAQTFCTAHFADSGALSRLAARAFHAGEIDLARDLSARARTVARNPAAAADADLVRQEIRLHQRRFTEILATPEPSRRAAETVRTALQNARLRAGVERGERGSVPAEIDAVIALCTSGKAGADDLHLLCLHVGARIAAGEGASVTELADQVAAAAAQSGDERLVFLAAGNQAALARRSGDRPAERRALIRAAATSDGTRGIAEIVAMNALMARTEDDPASPAARSAWLRAALAWLAFEPVEAFPVGAVEALVGTASVARAQIDQRVSEAIAAALAKAAPGLAAVTGQDAPLPTVRPASAATEPTLLIGGPGAAVLGSTRRIEGLLPSPSRLRLIGLAWAMLRDLCPAAATADPGTILVDDGLGTDLPATRDTALAAALRAGVGEFCFGREKMAIDASTRPRLAAELRIVLSPAVATIGGSAEAPRIHFRRHLEEATAKGRDAEIIAAIRGGGRITLGSLAVLIGTPLAETEKLLRGLEARRIVRAQVEAR